LRNQNLNLLGFNSEFKVIPSFFSLAGALFRWRKHPLVLQLSLQIDSDGVPFQVITPPTELLLKKRLFPTDSVVWSFLCLVGLMDASGRYQTVICSCFHPCSSEFRRWLLWLKQADCQQFRETGT
jgi:hypothetical protein